VRALEHALDLRAARVRAQIVEHGGDALAQRVARPSRRWAMWNRSGQPSA
jgi:hypothetical protein